MQESMITFSVFLQDNEKKKNKANDKIKSEKILKDEKVLEYERKKKEHTELEKKAKRIELKKKALLKYENYLEEVQKSCSDEFSEIPEILARYETLIKENIKLNENHKQLETKVLDMKESTTRYIKEKETEIMKLNNDISTKKTDFEKICDEQSKLREEAEINNKNKQYKVTELAQILMAIENIEQKCFNRQGIKQAVKHIINIEKKPQNFNDLAERVKYSKAQLAAIKNYLFDYKEISRKVQDGKEEKGDKEIANYINELKNQAELI